VGPCSSKAKGNSERVCKKEEKKTQPNTYADTIEGCFGVFWNWAAYAAASCRLVMAAVFLGFFGRLPNSNELALRFCAPPGAVGAAEELAPALSVSCGQRGSFSSSSSSG
jgi:hypothetical protein